jgi:valyl-tRNA synthetase
MQLPSTYNHSDFESDIYKLWEVSGVFSPKLKGEPYTMILPPPNANARLHIGSAYDYNYKDVLARFKRQQGFDVLMLPGADHAGFETWYVYEKHLTKQGKSRFDYSREELYSQVWDFVEENKTDLNMMYRKLGLSADWSRFTYTLDQKIVDGAYKVFERMWNDGLIYRGERLVNFCITHGTSFSDIEVEYKDEPGKLYYIKYPLAGSESHVIVATTRPETMLGDEAVAIHPENPKLKHLIGKLVELPLTKRQIPIIADQMAEIEFGTGAVKITPAHDNNDYQVANRHDLPIVNIIGEDGNLNDHAPEKYQGMDLQKAREVIIEDLTSLSLIEKVEEYNHSVGHCYKCGNPIQPLLKEQWFVNMKPLAAKAIEAIEAGEINFYPKTKKAQAISYLMNIKDWNISRQIAWGIPIPAFQNVDDASDWIFSADVDRETLNLNNKTYKRDSDVFDTWFSSGQWPYLTLDYPNGDDYEYFYPTQFMGMGIDILNQWALRMIMLGLYNTGEVPFKDLYLHGMIRAEDGGKMSKSLGNVVDPFDMIESYGADGLRMGLLSGRRAGVSGAWSKPKFIAGRNFCNKLWNIARFIEGKLGEDFKFDIDHCAPSNLAEHWLASKLNQAAGEISESLESYDFHIALDTLTKFVWDDYADWFIESAKKEYNPHFLYLSLISTLIIAHSFAPFVTETIWQTLPFTEGLVAQEVWPKPLKFSDFEAQQFKDVAELVTTARSIQKLNSGSKLKLSFNDDVVAKTRQLIASLAKAELIDEVNTEGYKIASNNLSLTIVMSREELSTLKTKLTEQIDALHARREALEARLTNKSYIEGAPKELVDQSREELDSINHQISNAKKQLSLV